MSSEPLAKQEIELKPEAVKEIKHGAIELIEPKP